MPFVNQTKLEEKCVCGRPLAAIHCPTCGAQTKYPLPSISFDVPILNSDKKRHVMVYRCRGCGIEYNDIEREKCEAPMTPQEYKRQREASRMGDEILNAYRNAKTTDERQKVLKGLFPTGKKKPFEIGDDRKMLEQAMRENAGQSEPEKEEPK